MKTKLTPLLLIIIALAGLAGCATSGRKIDTTALVAIKPGESKPEDVTKAIGSPDQIFKESSGKMSYIYQYFHMQTSGKSFIPIYGSFAGGGKMQNQMVTVMFTNGIVSSISESMGASNIGTGAEAGKPANLPEVEAAKRPK